MLKLHVILAKKTEMKKLVLSMLALSTMAFYSCGEKEAETEKEVAGTENVEVAKISGTYDVVDASVVTWNARHYQDTVNAHTGTVAVSAGTIVVADENIVGGEFSFDMTSILEAGEPNDYTVMLQSHLMDTAFFFVADFATSSFTVTNVTDGVLTGNLEVLGVSQELSFPLNVEISAESVNATAEFDVNLLDFGLQALVAGDVLPEEEKMQSANPTITFQLDISASKAAH